MWWALWILSALVPFSAWMVIGQAASVRLSWAVLAVLAGITSLSGTQKRKVGMPFLSLFLLLFLARQMIIEYPSVVWVRWTEAWWIFAALGTSFCFVSMVGWGTQVLVNFFPNPRRYLAPALFAILSLNLVFFWLQKRGIFSIWTYAFDQAGLFPNRTVWGAWCVISFPILFGRGKLFSVPSVIGLLTARSSSALGAFFLLMIFPTWIKLRMRHKIAIIVALASVMIWSEKGAKWYLMDLDFRVRTWVSVSRAILRHPFGIGWAFNSYQNALVESTGVIRYSTLPNPSSDVLLLILRLGWWTAAFVAWLIIWFARNFRKDPISKSLAICGILSAIQTSVSTPQVGFLAWILACVWLMERSDIQYAEEREGRAQERAV